MEEEKEQMVEEEEMESMFSPNALLSPLQATPGPVLASSPFWNENMLSSISFFSSLNGWNIFESFCNTCLSSCINDIFWPTGADLEEENCFIQPPFSDFLVRFILQSCSWHQPSARDISELRVDIWHSSVHRALFYLTNTKKFSYFTLPTQDNSH